MSAPSERSKKFQWALVGIFGLLAVIAVFVFASVRGTGKGASEGLGAIVVWGTLPQDVFDGASSAITEAKAGEINYQSIPAASFHRALTEAIASGLGPDLILIDDSRFLLEKPTLTPISYERITERIFRDTFIEGGEIFLTTEGVYALPLLVDPLVLYYNRDHLSSAAVAQTPRFWDEFLTLAPILTKKSDDARIVRSALAFGEYANVTNAKEILATLITQAGSEMVSIGPTGSLESRILISPGGGSSPATAALRFYTEFSNPIKTVYSWNRSLPASKQAFLAGDLTFYIGFASEANALRLANPNLNFDAVVMPQSRQAVRRSVYGKVYALAVPNGARSPVASLAFAQTLAGAPIAGALSEGSLLAPARRDLLSAPQTNAFSATLFESAIMTRPWLDPEPTESVSIFSRMVSSVTSGAATLDEATRTANDQLTVLFR